MGTSIVMITHDLGVISETADHVIVMYAGEKVEEANVQDLFKNPKHPYTQGLMKAIPNLDKISKSKGKPDRLEKLKVLHRLYMITSRVFICKSMFVCNGQMQKRKSGF